MGKSLIDSNIFPIMNEHELMSDEKVVYIYLLICSHRTLHGLFEINLLETAYQTGISKDRIPHIFSVLQNHKLIYYSNKLIFIPAIPVQENFVSRLHDEKLDLNKKNFRKALSKYSIFRGETTPVNKAYQAFCEHYKDEIPFIIEKKQNGSQTDGKLFSNSFTTVSEPLQNTLSTVSDPLTNPLQTVGQKNPNPLQTVGEPLGENPLTVSEPLNSP